MIAGFKVSSNLKTGKSINLDHESCQPTKLCRKTCYGKEVCGEEAARLGIHANIGWITKPICQEAYARNREILERASDRDLDRLADRVADQAWSLGNIRLCGMGDLIPPLVELAARLPLRRIKPWGFSKKPKMVELLAKRCHDLWVELGDRYRPYVIGSADKSMPKRRVDGLIRATERLNGEPALAHMTMEPGWVGQSEVNSLWYREHLVVVFGYHTSHHRTHVMHHLACPATNGDGIHCQDCRRCMGEKHV